jgi:hypothetical protein
VKLDKPDQRTRAMSQVKALKLIFPDLVRVKDELSLALDEAQNPPPHGRADGSISPELWGELRLVRVALRDLLVRLTIIKS